MFNTPILFLIYNRPEVTMRVFAAIIDIQPKYLYIAADGPKDNLDVAKCLEARKVLELIDWDCELKILFREHNLGCRDAISSAITWFFDQVEQGIILEDDCLPNSSFFLYCDALLNTYKFDDKITMISGSNHLFDDKYESREGYFFSTYCNIWGWASWSRVMQNINWYPDKSELSNNQKKQFSKYLIGNEKLASGFYGLLDDVVQKKFNTWDIVLFYNLFKINGINIFSLKNLVSNIGNLGTHANGSVLDITLFRSTFEIDLIKLDPICDQYDVYNSANIEMMNNIQKIVCPPSNIILVQFRKLKNKLSTFFSK